MRDALRTGGGAGLIAAGLLSLLEALVNVGDIWSSGASFIWILLTPFFYLMLIAPFTVIAGGVLNLGVWFWHGRDSDGVYDALRASYERMKAGALAWHGKLVGVTLVTGGWVAIGIKLHLMFVHRFQNQTLKGALLATLMLTAGVVWATIVRGALGASAALINWARGRGEVWSRVLSSPKLLMALFLVGLIGACVALSIAWDTIEAIGKVKVFWLASVPIILLMSSVAGIWWRARWRLRWIAPTILVALLVGVGMGESDGMRQASLMTEGVVTELVDASQKLTDFDGDGASGFFGGGDCEPWDDRIGPHALEIVGNGVDENCIDGDLNASKLNNHRAFIPPPEGVLSRPNIVLITVDALRADHLGLYGYKRNTSPEIDRHAERAVVFERAYSQEAGTIGSMPSMMFSKQSDQLTYTQIDTTPNTISYAETSLAEDLLGVGYTTGGISTIRYTKNFSWGFIQGFEWIDDSMTHPDPAFGVTAPKTLALAKKFVQNHRDKEQPFFLWVHFFDAHTEYLKHEGFKSFGRSRMDLYDGEVFFVDHHIGQLLDTLLEGEHRDNTIVVLASDHGEGFHSDRGKINHGYGLFEEQLRTPLLVWAPNAKHRRVKTPVANLDIMPTLLSAVGVKRLDLMGHSLMPYLYEDYSDPTRVVFSTYRVVRKGVNERRKSAVSQRYKYIRWLNNNKEFLFDLESDPGEKKNVIRDHVEAAQSLRQATDRHLDRVSAKVAVIDDNPRNDLPRRRESTAPENVVFSWQSPGKGGDSDHYNCPSEQLVDAFEVRYFIPKDSKTSRELIASLRVACRSPRGDALTWSPWRGKLERHQWSAPEHEIRCKREGDIPIGIRVRKDRFLNAISLICAQPGEEHLHVENTEWFGSKGGRSISKRCPNGSAIGGYQGRSGGLIDAVGFSCVPLDLKKFNSSP